MSDIDGYLVHLSGPARVDIVKLFKDDERFFNDAPSQTTVLNHDIDVGNHKPI